MKYGPFSFWTEIVNYLKEHVKKTQDPNVSPIKENLLEMGRHFQVEELLSIKIPAGKKVYYFDIKMDSEGSKYLQITEINKHENENILRNRIVIQREYLKEIKKAFDISLDYIIVKESYKDKIERKRLK